MQRLLPPVIIVRKLLSIRDPPIDEVLGAGIVRPLIQMLDPSYGYELRTEAAWALTNIGSGTAEHAAYLIREARSPPRWSAVPARTFGAVACGAGRRASARRLPCGGGR